ncbi:MAG: class IV adenylate cyclase [Candidatus Lindowbacteria bacterium]|nr:class IV adenylate cyclase [Candidatus Lindowbacteria bacterium]
MRNIELKVSVDGFDGIMPLLMNMGAVFAEIIRQVDTYYETGNGRLKIREINDCDFELIFYQRPNRTNSRISNYHWTTIASEQLRSFKHALGKALGEKAVVKKERRLWMYGNTRIHLDEVVGLGTFLELETVVKKGCLKEARVEHKKVVESLGLSRFKKIPDSYSDMLLQKKKTNHKP